MQENRSRSFSVWYALVWTFVVLFVLLTFAWQVLSGLRIETNILALLPPTEKNPIVERSLREFTENVGKRSIFLITHPLLDTAREASNILGAELESSNLFREVIHSIPPGSERSVYDSFFPHRYQVLPKSLEEQLKRVDQNPAQLGDFLATRAAVLYSPISGFFSGLLERDPLLFFADLAQQIPRPSDALQIVDGKILVNYENVLYVMVIAVAKGNPFSGGDARELEEISARAVQIVHQKNPGVIVRESGVYRFALASARQARMEASTVGTGSLLGVLLLMLFAFRSLKQMFLGAFTVSIGVLCAFVCCHLVFGNVHVITLAFGASLIGVAIDYSFHFFSEQLFLQRNESGQSTLRKVLGGITLGALTSLIAYAGLSLAPFPGLRQMALFSSVGILAAYASVLFWYPVICPGRAKEGQSFPRKLSAHFLRLWSQLLFGRAWKYLIVVLALVGGYSCLSSRINDDIRLLQNMPQDLMSEESMIRSISGGVDASRFFVIEGASPDEVLAREALLLRRLERLKRKGVLSGYQGISELLPPRSVQRRNAELVQRVLLTNKEEVSEHLAEIGFRSETVDGFFQELSKLNTRKPLTVDALLAQPFAQGWRHLWLGRVEAVPSPDKLHYASIVLLENVQDSGEFETLESQVSGAYYVNKVDDISHLLSRYRIKSMKYVALAYFAIFLLLYVRYGLARAVVVMIPPLLAVSLSIGVLNLMAIPLNLFVILGFMLVLGIGIDFTIFFSESGESFERPLSDRASATMLAILLSSATTILSFGLLSLSETAALQSFGIVLFSGIFFVTLLSPLALCVSQDSK